MRELHAQPGVPPGFSDAVAWLVPGDTPRGASRSPSTTSTAWPRAADLGGEVLTPPFDEEGARLAVLCDVAGALLVL